MRYFICVLVSLFVASSCTKKSTPEGALRNFVEYRFETSQSKSGLLELTTGALQEKIESMEDEDLKKFLDVKNLKRRKFTVLVKNCEEASCFLTYVLRYSQGKENPKEFGVEVKKIAKVEMVEKSWKLSEISNVKTYIDSKKSLDVSAKGEASAP